MPETEVVEVLTTMADRADASRIASHVVQIRLAACAQIEGPIESHYRWQGVVETASEWRLSIKTTRAAVDRLIVAIQANHPYEEPEILVVPISVGSPSYLQWVLDQVSNP